MLCFRIVLLFITLFACFSDNSSEPDIDKLDFQPNMNFDEYFPITKDEISNGSVVDILATSDELSSISETESSVKPILSSNTSLMKDSPEIIKICSDKKNQLKLKIMNSIKKQQTRRRHLLDSLKKSLHLSPVKRNFKRRRLIVKMFQPKFMNTTFLSPYNSFDMTDGEIKQYFSQLENIAKRVLTKCDNLQNVDPILWEPIRCFITSTSKKKSIKVPPESKLLKVKPKTTLPDKCSINIVDISRLDYLNLRECYVKLERLSLATVKLMSRKQKGVSGVSCLNNDPIRKKPKSLAFKKVLNRLNTSENEQNNSKLNKSAIIPINDTEKKVSFSNKLEVQTKKRKIGEGKSLFHSYKNTNKNQKMFKKSVEAIYIKGESNCTTVVSANNSLNDLLKKNKLQMKGMQMRAHKLKTRKSNKDNYLLAFDSPVKVENFSCCQMKSVYPCVDADPNLLEEKNTMTSIANEHVNPPIKEMNNNECITIHKRCVFKKHNISHSKDKKIKPKGTNAVQTKHLPITYPTLNRNTCRKIKTVVSDLKSGNCKLNIGHIPVQQKMLVETNKTDTHLSCTINNRFQAPKLNPPKNVNIRCMTPRKCKKDVASVEIEKPKNMISCSVDINCDQTIGNSLAEVKSHLPFVLLEKNILLGNCKIKQPNPDNPEKQNKNCHVPRKKEVEFTNNTHNSVDLVVKMFVRDNLYNQSCKKDAIDVDRLKQVNTNYRINQRDSVDPKLRNSITKLSGYELFGDNKQSNKIQNNILCLDGAFDNSSSDDNMEENDSNVVSMPTKKRRFKGRETNLSKTTQTPERKYAPLSIKMKKLPKVDALALATIKGTRESTVSTSDRGMTVIDIEQAENQECDLDKKRSRVEPFVRLERQCLPPELVSHNPYPSITKHPPLELINPMMKNLEISVQRLPVNTQGSDL